MTVQTVLDKSEIASAYCLLQEIIGWTASEFCLTEKHTLANQYVFTRRGTKRKLYIDCEPIEKLTKNVDKRESQNDTSS